MLSFVLAALLPHAFAVPDACDEGYGSLAYSELLSESDLSVVGFQPFDNLGWSITDVGDFDGDGVHDVAVGVPGDRTNGVRAGAVFLYLSDGGTPSFAAPSVRLFGSGTGDNAGAAVAGAGDVNGDGLDDLLVGAAPNWRSTHSAGIAWLVLGSAHAPSTYNLSSDAEAVLVGSAPGDRFGAVVAGVGDVNGDGYGDVAIGAPGADVRGTSSGAAFVYFGPVQGSAAVAADRALWGATAGDQAGASIVGLGDVDGDHVDDLAVGAPLAGSPAGNDGAVYVVTGGAASGPMLLSDAAATLRGVGDERAGSALAVAGDVDHDGRNELWVTARSWGVGRRGAAYLVDVDAALGTVDLLDSASLAQLRGSGPADQFGGTIAGGQDVDGDNVLDVVVGAAGANGASPNVGAAWVLSGPFVGVVRATAAEGRHGGWAAGGRAGAAVALFPDLNADGFADVLVGAPRTSAARHAGVGSFHVLFGGADRVDALDWYADVDRDGWGAGAAVRACAEPPGRTARAGDCDDRTPAVHPYAAESDCADPVDYSCDGSVGAVDLDLDGVSACANDCDDRDPTVAAGQPERCGNGKDDDCSGLVDDVLAVDALPWRADSDHDGFGDAQTAFVACEPPAFFLEPATLVGGDCDDRVAARHPGADERCDFVDNDCDGVIDGWSARDALDWFADLDHDGLGDSQTRVRACIRPLGYEAAAGDCDDADPAVPGSVEVCNFRDDDCDGAFYLGGAVSTPTWSLTGALPARLGTAQLGVALGAAPDMDGDGFDELLVSGANGVVYVLGEPPVSGAQTILDPSIGGELAVRATLSGGAGFGAVVVGGDFDGDGVGDVAVADPTAAEPSIGEGVVFVFYGPLFGPLTTGAALGRVTGVDGDDRVGSALAAGDLNHDGADELLIGAPGADLGLEHRGAVLLVVGDPTRAALTSEPGIASLPSVRGFGARDELGSAVAVLGDVDGDGQGDVAAAAQLGGATDAGYVAVAPGAAFFSGLVQPARVSGASPGLRLGRAVAGGDVDGDGYDDLVVSGALGRLWVVPGGADGVGTGLVTDLAAVEVRGPAGQDLGAAVAVAPDVDGDGDDEVVVGAPGDDTVIANAGVVHLIYGGPRLPSVLHTDTLESFGRLDEGSTFPTYSAANAGGVEGASLAGPPGGRFGGVLWTGFHGRAGGGGDILGAASGLPQGMILGFATGPYGVDVPPAGAGPLSGAEAWWPDADGDGQADAASQPQLTCPMHELISWAASATQPAPRLAVRFDAGSVLDCDDGDAAVYTGAPDLAGSRVEDCALRVYGCTDAAALNFDPSANTDDGGCLLPGCVDPLAYNFDRDATWDDGSCQYVGPCDGRAADIRSPADVAAVLGCSSLAGLRVDHTSGVQAIELPWLEEVHGAIDISDGAGLERVSLPALREVDVYLTLSSNLDLVELDLPVLTSVRGYVLIVNNPALCVDGSTWAGVCPIFIEFSNGTCP